MRRIWMLISLLVALAGMPVSAAEVPTYGWAGVRVQAVTDDTAQKAGMTQKRGALVVGVDENSPMKAAGVIAGDILVRYDGHQIKDAHDLQHLISATLPGKQVEVVAVRNGKEEIRIISVGRLADAETFYTRGRDYYINKKDSDRALADFNEAIRLDPKMAAAYGGRAAAYERLRASGAFIDPNDKAFTDYRTALALAPGDQWSIAGIRRILTNDAPALADLTGTAAAFSDPIGSYAMSGTNPDSTTYAGEVVVQSIGDKYQVSWTAAKKQSAGIGVRYLDFLAVSFHAGNDAHLALFAQEGGGRLGVWVRGGGQQLGSERWVRPSGEAKTNVAPAALVEPTGQYAISGANADGSTYAGDVVVTRAGQVFQVAKTIAGQKSIGTGIAYGNFFAVTYRSGNNIQLALLTSRGTGQIGIWADDASNRLGTERWTRKPN